MNTDVRTLRQPVTGRAVCEQAILPTAGRRTDTEDSLWAALHHHPGATATELACAAGIGRSTASKILATWQADGTVTRTPGIADGGKRAADRWSPASTDEDTDSASDVDHDTTTDVSTGNNAVADAADTDTDTDQPDTVPHPPDPTNTVGAAGPAEVPAQADTTSKAGKKRRLRGGELRGQVEEFLRDRNGQAFGPSAIGKALGRSSGAVNNALERLVVDGYAMQTNDKPKRFTLKPDTDKTTAEHTTNRPQEK